jgi:hypothetical protein
MRRNDAQARYDPPSQMQQANHNHQKAQTMNLIPCPESVYLIPCPCGAEVRSHAPETVCPKCSRILEVRGWAKETAASQPTANKAATLA